MTANSNENSLCPGDESANLSASERAKTNKTMKSKVCHVTKLSRQCQSLGDPSQVAPDRCPHKCSDAKLVQKLEIVSSRGKLSEGHGTVGAQDSAMNIALTEIHVAEIQT